MAQTNEAHSELAPRESTECEAPAHDFGENRVIPNLPYCTPGCCETECVVRTGFLEASARSADLSAHGADLESLRFSELRDRFYCWHGASGARYVCKVFTTDEEASVAEFSKVVIVGVVRSADAPLPICFIESGSFDTSEGRALRQRAREMGCTEWHVYFGDSAQKVRDFAASFRP